MSYISKVSMSYKSTDDDDDDQHYNNESDGGDTLPLSTSWSNFDEETEGRLVFSSAVDWSTAIKREAR